MINNIFSTELIHTFICIKLISKVTLHLRTSYFIMWAVLVHNMGRFVIEKL